MMKRTVFLLSVSFWFHMGVAQPNYYDSAKMYCQKDYSIALIYADSAIQISDEDMDLAKANYMLGYIYWGLKDYLKSIDHYEVAMELYRALDRTQFMYLHLNQGANYELINSFKIANKYYDETIVLAKEMDDEAQLAKALRQKARLYRKMDRLDSAVTLNLEALKYYRKENKRKEKSAIYNEVGLVLLESGIAQGSLDYFYAAEQEVDFENYRFWRSARTKYYVGKAYLQQADTVKALEFFNKADDMFREMTPGRNHLSLLYHRAPLTENPQEAYLHAIEYAETNDLTKTNAYRNSLYEMIAYGAEGYLEKYKLINDQIINEKNIALAASQEWFGKEYYSRLKAAAILSKTSAKIGNWEWIILLVFSSITPMMFFLIWKRAKRGYLYKLPGFTRS